MKFTVFVHKQLMDLLNDRRILDQKRVIEYGEWLLTNVLKKVPHRHRVFSNDAIIESMLSWRHTGFHVHIGASIWPEDETALGNPAEYIICAGFSQERMVYIPAEKSVDGIAGVVYSSKDGSTQKKFDALDRLAGLVVHVPNKYEQLVRYDPPAKDDFDISEPVYDSWETQIPPYKYWE